jgi:hypothetical protein
MISAIYLDTTIPSYYFDNRITVKFQSNLTKKWFKQESYKYNIFLSEATILELQQGNYPNKDKIIKFISQFDILKNDVQVNKIAEYYVKNYLMPKDYQGDALHLAYASYYKIDFLLTWNCNHLANANKRQHIRVINSKLNLNIPEIVTPLELFSETK